MRVDAFPRTVIPIASVAAMTLIGAILEATEIVRGFYASPYVLVAGIIANRVCVVAGLFAAALGAAAFNLFFVTPRYQFTWPTMEEWLAYASMAAVAYFVARRVSVAPERARIAEGSKMPFIDDTNVQRSFWAIKASGTWADDAEVGQAYGSIYVREVQAGRTAVQLGWIIDGMIEKGEYTGVEAGFASEIQREITNKPLVPHHDPKNFGRNGATDPNHDVGSMPIGGE